MTTLTTTSRRPGLRTYTRIDALTTLKRADMILFTLLLPLGMYLFWGAMQDYSDIDVGRGNVAASTMVNMAVFSVAVAATCTAAGAAVELAGGWGRQMALTPVGTRGYVLVKLLGAVIVSAVPVTVIFIAGLFTGAEMDAAWVWAASYLLALAPTALLFGCYGLAVGLWFPAQGAVGLAGTSIALFGFLGNLFMPLDGTLFTLSRFTPIYGVGALGTRPILGDDVIMMSGIATEALWVPLTNMIAWTLLFALVGLAARRRTTRRR